MKFTIRFSILSFFVCLLLVTGFSIITANLYILDKVLLKSATSILYQTSSLIRSKLIVYLQPLDNYTVLTRDLIANGILQPSDKLAFRSYVLNIMKQHPNVYASYWGTPQGDYNSIIKVIDTNKKFHNIVIHRTAEPAYEMKYLIDENNVLETEKFFDPKFDPRVRPWYTITVKEKKKEWSDIYRFTQLLLKRHNVPLGISVAAPVYDKEGKLEGVFAMDTTLNDVANFMSSLKATANTAMFVIDHSGNYMASSNTYNLMSNKAVSSSLQNISNFGIPWAKHSFDLYKKNHKAVFIYKVKGKKYIAAYRTIDSMFDGRWYIGIALPIGDIVAPLKSNLFISLEIALLLLLIGIVSSRFIAGKIAEPIMQLAHEAHLIASLKFAATKKVSSFIKEVYAIQSAFDAMKNGVSSFSRYVPFTLVQSLIKSGQVAHVGGESRQVSILFSDIRGFTSLSENIPPQELMFFLSEYFEEMTKIILKNKGTVDKYIGDAIMAFWGAPLADEEHAMHACQAALSLYEALDAFNKNNRARGIPEIGMRLAVNSGEAIVGNVGSNDRLSYTAIGDNVNLASRLEELNKDYGTNIIVSESVHEKVKEQFQFRLLDRIAVRGKKRGGYVFELLRPENELKECLSLYNETFREAFVVYEQGEWKQAVRLFERMKLDYSDDKLIEIYINRCLFLQKEKPKNWNGIWIVDER